MTGNDIIDLSAAAIESNWKRKGFLEKQFTEREQLYIQHAISPDEMVWRLWSMKESAYKIYIRQYGGRFFAPYKFSCRIFNDVAGTVDINNNTYQTTSTITKDYIYSIAKPINTGDTLLLNYCFYIADIDLNKQDFIYSQIFSCYTKLVAADKNSISIFKTEAGIPFLHCKDENKNIPVSITHHGNYAACTIN